MKTTTTDSIFTTLRLYRLGLGKNCLLLAGAMVMLTACATAPRPPLAELQAAERAISEAEQAQVVRYTTTELNTARTELTAARNAVTAENMPQAQRLALQAELSAELAVARAELLKAEAINKDMQQSIEALRQETQRNVSGVRP
ncbi:DUF4398 domain-containing protein [Arsukibacterium sp. MJ3]|uniref:DUF4398 domain-containing protein n=1 Tax=Arsukibacterium sp. MJ3 TaxID=1632859 RepID=UPI0009E28C27|nr:DUF4398 domain-containing protein [Arsukibacterium sp. MJ3]